MHDGLTGIFNRRAFDDILAREIKIAAREQTKLTLLMIDVDCFKTYNDRYGHPAGDAALCGVSTAICRSIRRPADIAARYGGEEFVVLLPGTDEAGGQVIATAIQTSIQQLKISHELSPFGALTVSIGIATSPDFAGNRPAIDALVDQADIALYIAKREGKNKIVAWTSGRDLLYEYIDLLIELFSNYNLTYFDTVLSVIDDYLSRASLLNSGGDANMHAALFEAITSHLPVDSDHSELSEMISEKLGCRK